MKLITEHTTDVRCLIEEKDGKKSCLIEGIFMQAEKENRNGRIYPRAVLEEAVDKYVSEQVKTGRAVGELDHPDGPKINLDKVSHKITELKWAEDDVYGKAVILDTPMGQIARGLIEGGVQLGVSSRGLGGINEKNNKSFVSNYLLSTVDIVQDPSAHNAFVNGIMEGVEYVVTKDGHVEEYLDEMAKKLHKTSKINLAEQQIAEWQKFMNFLTNGAR